MKGSGFNDKRRQSGRLCNYDARAVTWRFMGCYK